MERRVVTNFVVWSNASSQQTSPAASIVRMAADLLVGLGIRENQGMAALLPTCLEVRAVPADLEVGEGDSKLQLLELPLLEDREALSTAVPVGDSQGMAALGKACLNCELDCGMWKKKRTHAHTHQHTHTHIHKQPTCVVHVCFASHWNVSNLICYFTGQKTK